MKYAVAALVIAILGTLASIFLSVGMGLKACPLCFYQRTFIMASVAVLGMGLLADSGRAQLLCLLSVPQSIAGLGVAGFHEYLVITGTLECPKGLFGLGTAPAQSLLVFVALSAVTIAGASLDGQTLRKPYWSGLAIVFGALLAWGAIASAPPLPPAPKSPYDPIKQPLDMCRPPYRGK